MIFYFLFPPKKPLELYTPNVCKISHIPCVNERKLNNKQALVATTTVVYPPNECVTK
jgi:hypothetical protein